MSVNRMTFGFRVTERLLMRYPKVVDSNADDNLKIRGAGGIFDILLSEERTELRLDVQARKKQLRVDQQRETFFQT